MKLLDCHLENISQCSAGIAELPFPPPKIFTNALLQPHDITALIRDTEVHERALFTYSPLPIPGDDGSRRATNFQAVGSANPLGQNRYSSWAPRRRTAVAMVLGGDMMAQIEKNGGLRFSRHASYTSTVRSRRGDLDVEVLLKGAEKLCNVYPIPGAKERIEALRSRYSQLKTSISDYEAQLAYQTAQLEKMNHPQDYEDEEYEDEEEYTSNAPENDDESSITDEDVRLEEEEVRELERRKAVLQERVRGMERDLGGLRG